MRLRRGLAAALAVLAVAAGCARTTPTLTAIPTASPQDSTGFGPGSDGIGDSYYPTAGNGGYDVANYDLDLTYDPGSAEISGRATIEATATANLTSFNLDFTGLDPSSVTVDGVDARWEHRGSELVVSPGTPLPTGATFTTAITYAGQPQAIADLALGTVGFLTTADGAVAIGEPEVAATWFPVNDHPRDKATYTIRISAPSGVAALSNGVLVSRDDADRAGYTAWTWRVSSPMAPYLATIVVGNYRVQESTHDGMPVVLAVHSSLSPAIDSTMARTPEVLDYLETVFGPYPFDALGGIVINDQRITYALENQTRPIYSSRFFRGGDATPVIAHELAHQWFGDSVSVHDWSEIWLNEGFASYAEWLWAEHQGGVTPHAMFTALYDDATDRLWSQPAGAPGRDGLFSSSVYTRGAMTVHALRVTVGDDAFFRILREWPARKKDSTATTQELIAVAEEISGRELDALFQDWLYDTDRPPRP